MPRLSRSPQGWVSLYDAADRFGLHHVTLQKLVKAGHFTRLGKTPGKTAAIYLPEDEVNAFVVGGGLDAVAKLRRRKDRAARRGAAKVKAGA